MPLPANVVIVDVEQGSPEWFAARAGRVTSSGVENIFKQARKGSKDESVGKRDYRIQLANEQMTGRSTDDDSWKGEWVERGKRLEPDARFAYELKTGYNVKQAGFIKHTQFMVGTSVDGYVNDFERVVEFKVPKPATHLRYLMEPASLKAEYDEQGLHHFYVTGCQFVDFVSYCPDVDDRLQLLIVTAERPSLTVMSQFSMAVGRFLEEVERQRRDVEALISRVEAEAGVSNV